MLESESEKFTWKDKENISIFASIAVGTAIIAIYLYIQNRVFTSGDLTNVFTFAIEIGIGIFISIMIFQYSKFQQSKSDHILDGIKAVNDTLERERISRKETFQKALISCLLDVWEKCTLIKLNLDHYRVDEDLRNNPNILENNKTLADIIQMNKIQLSLDLQELHTLTVLLGPDIDSMLITTLLELQKQSMDNIVQTGILRARLPWSTMIIGIDRIIKKYYPTLIEKFKIKDLEELMPEEYKEEIMQGRRSTKGP